MDPKLTSQIFGDPDFLELENDEKLLFFWMVVNCTLLGVVEATPRRINRDFDYKDGVLEGLTKGLPRGIKKLERGYWLKNYISRQLGRGKRLINNNVSKSLARELVKAPDDLYYAVLEEYPEFYQILESLGEEPRDKTILSGKGLPSPCQPLTKGKEKEKEKEKKGGVGENKPAPPPSPPDDPEARRPEGALLDFPCQKRGEVWWLTKAKCLELAESFPGVDVLANARVARQWCIDNPAKRKTPRGMANFVSGWIRRNNDRGQAVRLQPGQRQPFLAPKEQDQNAPEAEAPPPKHWRSALARFFEREDMQTALKRLKAGAAYNSWNEVHPDDRPEVRKIAEGMEDAA